ncbi:MAG: methyltransferase domain-containing protein [Solirubrobacteraceae bacterium]
MRRRERYTALTLGEVEAVPLPGGPRWHPVRMELGLRAFGAGAYTADRVGEPLVEPHTELRDGHSHEELYVVLAGRASFTIDGEELDAPAGTLVLVRDPAAHRQATAAEDGTAVLALGAPPTFAPVDSALEREPGLRGEIASDPELAALGSADAPPLPDFEVLAFVRASLPDPPARVLEVGAGRGELAAALARAGYDVVAIDPAGESPAVAPVALLEIEEPAASFDAAVAVVSLHHVEPLEQSCRRLADVVRPGAPLIVDEFDVERFDERAARWWIAQRAGTHEPSAMVADLRAHLHPVSRMCAALSPWFDLREPVRGPYLHRWDVPPGLRAAEEHLIAVGRLRATGARLIGRRR